MKLPKIPPPVVQTRLSPSHCNFINPREIIRYSSLTTVHRKDSYSIYNSWKGNFQNRVEQTKLNDDDLEPNYTVDNYQDKFYILLCFEEMEHISLLTKK